MKMNVSVHMFVVEPLATILWEATNACVQLDTILSSSAEHARTSTSVVLRKPLATMVAQTQMVAMSVAAHLDTSE